MSVNRTVYDHMEHARDEDFWIVVEHKRGCDGTIERAAFHTVECLESQWVRWGEHADCGSLHGPEDVAGELRESSAIQLRSSPPFEPDGDDE